MSKIKSGGKAKSSKPNLTTKTKTKNDQGGYGFMWAAALLVIALIAYGYLSEGGSIAPSDAATKLQTVYVSSEGNDTRDGLTPESALRSVTKAITKHQVGNVLQIALIGPVFSVPTIDFSGDGQQIVIPENTSMILTSQPGGDQVRVIGSDGANYWTFEKKGQLQVHNLYFNDMRLQFDGVGVINFFNNRVDRLVADSGSHIRVSGGRNGLQVGGGQYNNTVSGNIFTFATDPDLDVSSAAVSGSVQSDATLTVRKNTFIFPDIETIRSGDGQYIGVQLTRTAPWNAKTVVDYNMFITSGFNKVRDNGSQIGIWTSGSQENLSLYRNNFSKFSGITMFHR